MNEDMEFNITLDGFPYREHIILFVDILGYSRLVRCGDAKKKSAVLELQKQLLTSDMTGVARRVKKSIRENIISVKPLSALLSDTLIYSYPMADLEACENNTVVAAAYSSLANKLASLHALFLGIGVLIRGALTMGKITNHHGIAYGEGLAVAHELQKKGEKPFVFFDDALINLMNRYAGSSYINYFLRQDADSGLKYYDYFEHLLSEKLGNDEARAEAFARIHKYVLQINQNLLETQVDRKVQKKWCITAEYFDNAISSLNAGMTHPSYPKNSQYSGAMIDKAVFPKV